MSSWQYINPQSQSSTGHLTTSKSNWWSQTSQKPWSWYTSDQRHNPLLAYCLPPLLLLYNMFYIVLALRAIFWSSYSQPSIWDILIHFCRTLNFENQSINKHFTGTYAKTCNFNHNISFYSKTYAWILTKLTVGIDNYKANIFKKVHVDCLFRVIFSKLKFLNKAGKLLDTSWIVNHCITVQNCWKIEYCE